MISSMTTDTNKGNISDINKLWQHSPRYQDNNSDIFNDNKHQ